MKIKSVKKEVLYLLQMHPDLRDNDPGIISEIWKIQTRDISKLSALQFMSRLESGLLSSSESIVRCRRKLQEQFEGLRGKAYKGRHKEQEQVKQEIKNWNNEQEK